MRQRLTREGLFRRIAAPDEFSGRNMNTPIQLYDTHPNRRFPIGSVVTFVDDTYLRLRGTVLGHAAEDRLWVQWPNEIRQEDTSEVVSNDEIQDGGSSSTVGVIGSRGSRKATTLTFDEIDRFNEEDEEDEGLEYIPDVPDFLNGDPVVTDNHPTNEVHSGELPSEQDPRDKVEEDDDHDGECESFEVILELPEVGDMTDLIEDSITAQRTANGRQRVGANPFMWAAEQAGKGGDWLARKTGFDPDQAMSGTPPSIGLSNVQQGVKNWRERSRANLGRSEVLKQFGGNEEEMTYGYNLFKDKNVVYTLKMYGLSDNEIADYARLRDQHLSRASQKYQKQKESGGSPQLPSWGQGLGQMWIGKGYDYSKNLTPAQQAVYQRMSPEKQKEISFMPPARQQKFWEGMKKNYPQYFSAPPPTEQFPGTVASRAVSDLRNKVNLVDGILAMPRTADVVRQTVDLVSAIRELDDGKSLDETTRSALRNTSRNLLTATDHLNGVNNRIANRVAGEIEQLYVDALSN